VRLSQSQECLKREKRSGEYFPEVALAVLEQAIVAFVVQLESNDQFRRIGQFRFFGHFRRGAFWHQESVTPLKKSSFVHI